MHQIVLEVMSSQPTETWPVNVGSERRSAAGAKSARLTGWASLPELPRVSRSASIVRFGLEEANVLRVLTFEHLFPVAHVHVRPHWSIGRTIKQVSL
jgi:hypothetical protein